MEKETVLEIEFMPVWDKWAWRITKQDTDVLKRYSFKDTDINAISCLHPCFAKGTLFIRGRFGNLDDCVNVCTDKEKTIIEEKVKDINEKYGKPKCWRAERNGGYYYINDYGIIYFITDDYASEDNERYALGNYFQTREQAEKALERVKKALQEVEE